MSTPAWSNVPGAVGLATFGGFMYISSYSGNKISKIDASTGAIIDANWFSISAPLDLVIDASGTFMYAISGGHGSVFKINISNRSLVTWSFAPGISNPLGIVIDASGTFMYTSSWVGTITKINMSNGSIVNANWVSGLSNPNGLIIDPEGKYMYVANTGNGRISKINMSNGSIVNISWVSGLTNPIYLEIDNTGTYMYVSVQATQSIRKILIYNGTLMNENYISGLNNPNKLKIINNNMYVLNRGNGNIGKYFMMPDVICFKKDTKILTYNGYRLIQDLGKRDVIKTFNHGYKHIEMIGKTTIEHHALPERTKSQLYKCSKSEYPDLFEPLVITGCHSILVDEFSNEEEKQKTIEILGKISTTDQKYRLPAAADLRASVYETPGTYEIYHLALENDFSYMNYGIYANGLLVESCSKKALKEYKNMTVIK